MKKRRTFMKKLSVLMMSLLFAIATWAQTSKVTIKVNGSKNWNLIVDGETYNINSSHRTVTLTDLQPGQHTVSIAKPNTTSNVSTTTFTLRNGFNTQVTINGNGNINIGEARIKGYKRNNQYSNDVAHDAYGNVIYDEYGNPVRLNTSTNPTVYGYGVYGNNGNYNKAPLGEAAYNDLYNSIRKKWFLNSKYNSLRTAFSASANLFTTEQAKQLILLVSSEDNRLELAKLAYARIVDPMNFSSIYDVFSLQSHKDALDAYARSFRL
jgi:hypothetical protein